MYAIKLKRIYDEPSPDDGCRVLVDRLWPRGLSREKVCIDLWLKDIAPSAELRRWFNHEPDKWPVLKKRYFKELEDNREAVNRLIAKAGESTVTLVYAARDTRCNNAVALKEYIESVRGMD